jgi:DNA-binding NarL/FixJ family response regulator
LGDANPDAARGKLDLLPIESDGNPWRLESFGANLMPDQRGRSSSRSPSSIASVENSAFGDCGGGGILFFWSRTASYNFKNSAMKSPPSIRILCVDDHPIVREGLSSIIGTQADMAVVAEADDGLMAIEKYREHRPDIVVMDLRMPELGGVEATVRIREEFPAARIIILTTYEGDEDIHRALEAGARAYLLKDMARKDLLCTIREVQAGRRCIPSPVAARLAEHTPRVALSSRELEVLKHIAEGLRNKEIGAALNIAEDTVKIHVKNIFAKLNVVDRTQAVVEASQRGIIRIPRSD